LYRSLPFGTGWCREFAVPSGADDADKPQEALNLTTANIKIRGKALISILTFDIKTQKNNLIELITIFGLKIKLKSFNIY
jgi:hypothetical protein